MSNSPASFVEEFCRRRWVACIDGKEIIGDNDDKHDDDDDDGDDHDDEEEEEEQEKEENNNDNDNHDNDDKHIFMNACGKKIHSHWAFGIHLICGHQQFDRVMHWSLKNVHLVIATVLRLQNALEMHLSAIYHAAASHTYHPKI